MEVKKPTIKSIPYEDFKDNEYLENMVKQLNEGGTKVLVGCLDDLINWGRSNSLWPLTFATSCCGIEFMAVGAARYDFARFGFEVARASPRQADMIMVAGTITHKMAPVLKRLYDQMADPKYVIAVGGCAISGGVLKLHPKIVVENGAMDATKKYRGKINSVIMSYVKDMETDLKAAIPDRVFITHSGQFILFHIHRLYPKQNIRGQRHSLIEFLCSHCFYWAR